MKNTWVGVALVIVAGAIGSLASVYVFGKGTYDIGAFKVRLAVKPGAGETRISIAPETGALGSLQTGTAKAKTHSAPLSVSATIIGISSGSIPAEAAREPLAVDEYLIANNSSAEKKFGIKLGAFAGAGGLLGGVVVSMGKWKRMVGGLLAGLLVLGGLGLWTRQTYDTKAFSGTTFSRPG